MPTFPSFDLFSIRAADRRVSHIYISGFVDFFVRVAHQLLSFFRGKDRMEGGEQIGLSEIWG